MKKSTKGALAAGAAGALLLGGAGSLAYWTDSADVGGATITSGHLKLTTGTCDATWILDAGTDQEAEYTTQRLVPGDTLTRACNYTVSASGEHIEAELDVDKDPSFAAGSNAALLEELDISGSSITVDGAAYDAGTPVAVENGDAVVVNYVVTWPFNDALDEGSDGNVDNDSNVAGGGLTATLEALTVTLTQVDGHTTTP